MKFKTTQKAIKENYRTILKVGYCELQYLLTYEEPQAYTTRQEGWASDVYTFDTFAISTGYSPFGNYFLDYDLCQKYEKQAKEVLKTDFNYQSAKNKLYNLLIELKNEVLKNV